MPSLVLTGTPTFNADGSCTINSTGSDGVIGPGSILTMDQMWVAVRAKLAFASTDTTSRRFFTWGVDTNNELYLEWTGASQVGCGRDAGSTLEATQTPPAFLISTSHTVIGRWTPTGLSVSFDGAVLTAEFPSATLPTIPAGQFFDIGRRGYGTPANWSESDFYWVAIGRAVLSDADAAALHAFGDAGPATLDDVPGSAFFLWRAEGKDWDGRIACSPRRVPLGV